MSEKINRWLVFAEEDLRVAEIALEHGLFNQVCFHVQQCAEKSLKADLVESGSRVPKSHKMADLLSPSNDLFEPALRKEALLLDRFYIPTRYPDALPG